MTTQEPEQLRKGKAFHKRVQDDWLATAKGSPRIERPITKPGGRRGRVDVYVDAGDDLVALVEIKHSDWDRMTPVAVRRNVRRHIRQILHYIDSQIQALGGDKKRDVSAGVVFPRRPSDPERLKLIEHLFEEEGIPVVWEDETVEERAARS